MCIVIFVQAHHAVPPALSLHKRRLPAVGAATCSMWDSIEQQAQDRASTAVTGAPGLSYQLCHRCKRWLVPTRGLLSLWGMPRLLSCPAPTSHAQAKPGPRPHHCQMMHLLPSPHITCLC